MMTCSWTWLSQDLGPIGEVERSEDKIHSEWVNFCRIVKHNLGRPRGREN